MGTMEWLRKDGRLQKLALTFDTYFFKACGVSMFEVWGIIAPRRDREGRMKMLFYLIGTLTTFITLIGMFMGFMRAYYRYDAPKGIPPLLSPLSRHTRAGLVIGGILIWVFILVICMTGVALVQYDIVSPSALMVYLFANTIGMIVVVLTFNGKRYKVALDKNEAQKFGSARLGTIADVQEYYESGKGIYFGGGLYFNDKGHLLSIAGTRGGKGTNLVIPNMLGIGQYSGSWVVVDPKGEAVAIAGRYQQKQGKHVFVLNPWRLLSEHIPVSSAYNPFQLLADKESLHLIDDAQVIAEMLVPIDPKEHEKFFTDTARSIVAGLIAYIAYTKDESEKTLITLYKYLRLEEADWDEVLVDMYACKVEGTENGTLISVIAQEIRKVMKSGEKTWGIILTTMLQSTDFIKSPALQEAMKTEFNPELLRQGNAVLYVVIPADKLTSHSRWLRLVVMTLMRSVVRNPVKDKQVCFLLDEFSALGYLSEIEIALGTYAGYGITVWPILQSLIQLKSVYDKSWENFVANATVRTFFSINDNFTAKYLSDAMGTKTNVFAKVKKKPDDPDENETTARPLMAPDEVRRTSGADSITFVGDKPPLVYPKLPYYQMERFHPDGHAVYEANPYI
ncbi:type IV secretory system conjugative DNA transfer family protein [Rurimicrobium arvi]|uniref:Type IV secretory system conjugative DNA transfer family protein n=1 Tax=Rurimicrobium arvi TaxID=2049916 RepID=A0ABP8N1T1_9BACT